MTWPIDAETLVAEQLRLASSPPPFWHPPDAPFTIGGVFVTSPTGKTGAGEAGDRCWAGAAVVGADGVVSTALIAGAAGAPYEAGLLALREGPVLEAAVRRLAARPDVLLVNATGRDHPRRAGVALHLGARLDLPTVGVTHRPLVATGDPPPRRRGERAPLLLEGDAVATWLCTRDGTRPLVVHPAWRTDLDTAVDVVLVATERGLRTPESLRRAREVARTARAIAEGRVPG